MAVKHGATIVRIGTATFNHRTVTSEGDSSIAQTYSAYYSAEPNKSKYGYFIESKGKKAGKCNPKVLFDNGIERKTYTLSLLVEN